MKETHEYLVPDYYDQFICKMGACRSACCEGWPISLSMQDYFRLLGVDCSPELRRRLDCAMHLCERPCEEAYAQITPRYDGNCPMRLDDGRCAVHAELGEEALSGVCRLYPRGPRAEGDYECSCANSCEAVLELLFAQDAPISFHRRALTFDLPKPAGRTVFFETVGREQDLRLYFIHILQNRALSLPQRILSLGFALRDVENALNQRDATSIDQMLHQSPPCAPTAEAPVCQSQLISGLRTAESMLETLDERSPSIRAYGEAALDYFGRDDSSLDRYFKAKAHFESAFPKWEIWFEHMLVNHMFFERFPFQDRPESLYDEYIAICAVYAVLRFLGLGAMIHRDEEAAFVDVASAAFRLIDHTAFDRTASHILKSLGYASPEQLYVLIQL